MGTRAIVVLGCAVRPGGVPSPALEKRCRLALRLADDEPEAPVICSGGRRWSGEAEADVIRRRLLHFGVAEERLFVELRSMTTLDNALYTGELLANRQVPLEAVVATCAWHYPRALHLFRRCGIDACAPSADWIDSPDPPRFSRPMEFLRLCLDRSLLTR